MINIGYVLRDREFAAAHLNKFGNHTGDPQQWKCAELQIKRSRILKAPSKIRGQSDRLLMDEQSKTETVVQQMNAGYTTGGGSSQAATVD
ncbi:hypothetical protein T11_11151 [Trichinella zimbabwensis]|uniref:Uncharacterized protein n=1 Tax=Trichinella zimbabwensis TaxID=268475 RepID=A0A0V1GU97_9BILA|nr:hypothetical protein T11_11151 [Trichinella zimbabwensis]